jgi:rhomboid protease GluP
LKKPFPILSISLALGTLIASCTVATIVHGTPWSNLRILELHDYGVDNAQLANGQWWRLATAQFVHAKQAHMLFSVIVLFLLGVSVEEATGSVTFGLLWLVTGVVGTYASIYGVPPPYDIGSGASQALMGVAAAAIIVMRRGPARSPVWLKATLIITVAAQIGMDLVFGHSLKSGHTVPFAVGLLLAILLVRAANRKPVFMSE